MGVRNPHSKLLCICAALTFTFTVLQQPYAVTADKEVDSDIIFDNLEDSNTNHDRISRDLHLSHVNSKSSQTGDEHWMYKVVNRIKRGFLDSWFTTATPEAENQVDQEEDQELEQTQDAYQPSHTDKADNDYDQLEVVHNDTSYSHSNSYTNNDDEDLDSNFSGEQSGGAENDNNHGSQYPNHPAYYRIVFTVMEPFEEDFNNKYSSRYKRFAEEIEDNVDKLYDTVPGTQLTKVVHIQKRAADSFTCLVTLDLESKDYYDANALKSTIYDQISDYHTIGSRSVKTDDFNFRDFEGSQPIQCTDTELPCNSGECVPAFARCNGVSECPDNSDELGCPTQPTHVDNEANLPYPGEGESGNSNTEGSRGDIATSPPATSHPTLPIQTIPPPTHSTSSRCRADDVMRCSDGSVTICSDQECDGIPDCPNGEDERNCTTECAEGELGCDISRCIPQSHRCDGKFDCTDETDEADCPEPQQCQAGQFRCDNGYCIDNSRRCDGHNDCTRNEDEQNCPQRKRCKPDEFVCGDGSCIPSQKKCNSVADCPDRSDEKFCPCKESEFTCANGICIPAHQRCDKRRHCQDGSDEKHCPSKEYNNTGVECERHQRRCNDGTCLDKMHFCNGKHECADKSDELNCCMNDQFRCSNGTCLTLDKQCDGVGDCEYSEDEDNCARCKENEWLCNNGDCLHISKHCDGHNDCSDGSDELDCSAGTGNRKLECLPNMFRCLDNKKCIPYRHVCDYKVHCEDKSDENTEVCKDPRFSNNSATNPEIIVQGTCPENEFQCGAGYCIMGYKRCNGYKDCPSGNDEENCHFIFASTCGPNQFRCNDGQCIDADFRCDQIKDCLDESDERHCEGDCSPELHRCKDGTCIKAKLCDGYFDCPDGSDEASCELCAPNQFKCSSGACVPEDYRCDGRTQCGDGSDEENCVQHCPADQFRCGDGLCLDGRRRCDGYPDCTDQSDEHNCSTPTCPDDEFQCVSNKICINNNFRCDQIADCDDGSDEQGCTKGCDEDEFQCDQGGCIPDKRRCDGTVDCDDASDEYDCPSNPEVRPPCTASEFTCNDGTCLPQSRYCNGESDCPDHSDELDCGTCADPDWFQCADGACVASDLRCDNYYDCRDFSDEQNCYLGGCQHDEFQCGNGQCIPGYLRCNHRSECADGSDEHNCPTQAPPTVHECPRGQQACRSGNQCYLHAQHCDGRVDCNDLSDEDNCPLDTQACTHGHFRCENGPCIREELRCDGKVDCPLDSSDELDCPDYFNGSSDGLNLRTYPNQQEIKESREVVFQCRDEGPVRAKVHWSRGNGLPLPPGSRDINGRLEMPNIQVNHSGSYVCAAMGYPSSVPGAQINVQLEVNPYVAPTSRPPQACGLYESTCSNGDCIAKHLVCDGKFDCADGSDETRCNPHGCEPNEFRCANKRCILKTWRCDSDDDCGDQSDEQNCATNPPDSPCKYHQYACRSGNQCIPKSFHCDQSNDCADGSDEIGCSPVTILRPPPPMMQLQIGETFEVTCTAVGVPVPEIVWRLNWGHIPEKCRMTSENGVGTLICPDIQESDQGAYSCEGINIKGSIIATPDTILVVGPRQGVCPKGFFNEEARSPNECISCFCFGVTKECSSADLFTYHLQPPFDSHKFLGVKIDPITGVVDIRDEPIYKGSEPRLTPVAGRNGVHAQLEAPRGELAQPDVVPYFTMPENYHGNQLKSYGGYLKYNLKYEGYGRPTSFAPDIILTGNGYTLLHTGQTHQAGRNEPINIRFFVGEWIKRSETAPETLATREEIMMTLAAVENILIKLQYNDGHLDTVIENIEMDSAATRNTGLGQATYVEECRCPVGYSGLSCESCASGYSRHRSGPWLGQCYKELEKCPAGYYGDPSRGISCQVCPCPLTSPSNQFARTCKLDSDGDVTCDCPSEYVGRRCERCAYGYSGNPLIPGDYCKAASHCSAEGALQTTESGQCHCKLNTDGPTCNTCKKNTFHLSNDNQFGCIACFCMGITDVCSSSSWYRDQVNSFFTTSRNDFKLVESNTKHTQIEDGITVDRNSSEIVFSNFRRPDVYYWSLPSRFLGDKLTSYGGYLRYSLRYVPAPGGQSSKNNAPDVELISDNHISLTYFAREQPIPNTVQTYTVPLLEQHWQRSDGQKADREHLMMALADVKAILIKATYTTNTREAALQSVSLDIADERNTGNERALAVEQCMCPAGYKGLSCEDCDAGYTRTIDGIYLGRCEKCQCNGHSNECDSETGECYNCRDSTAGQNCDVCAANYEGDPIQRIPCRYVGGESSHNCQCDPSGSISNDCYDGACQCKTNVQGNRCDRCREGTFGLNGSIAEGCQSCFCSGVATECRESNLYVEQIPSQIFDQDRHGFILTDQNQREKITHNLQLNIAMNEIGYTFRPSTTDRLFWALPNAFTGYKIKSYGGKLEFTQRFTERPDARYVMDQDVIVIGNGITIYWTNPNELRPNIANKVSVTLSPSSKWQRLDFRQGPRPASREDILKVLANVNAILIRAQLSSDTASSFISDLTLDTAVDQYTGQPRATNVEVCICPPGYSGTSCELCSAGHYRDINDLSTGPLGSCSRCPCNGNEGSCNLGPENRVTCNCLPGYTGRSCDQTDSPVSSTPGPFPGEPSGPPTITVSISSPQLTIREIGGEVRFTCTARSTVTNNLHIQWNKADGQLPERAIDDRRGLLVITDLRITDSGNYICQANDGVSIVSQHVNLAVGANRPEAPRTQIHPTYLEVNEGEPIELHCSSSGNPSPSLYWTKVTRDQLNPRHTFVNGVFHIPNAQLSDEGEYHCTGSNSAGNHTSRTTVYVKSIAGQSIRPIINPSEYSGTSGESFTLTCEAGGPQRGISWSRQSGYLPYTARDESGILIVSNAKPEDSGIYICTVVDYNGASATATAKVNISPGNTGVYPSVKVEPTSQRVSQGSTLEIHCEASGSPTPIIKWTRLGEPLPSNIYQSGPTLKLHNVQVSDRGVYVCVVTNSLGLSQGSSIVEVERRETPSIDIHPKHTQTVTVGGSVILQCRINAGIPHPTIRWHRPNGQPLSSRIEQLSDGVLRITRISESEGGEYICTAENELGKVTAIGNIIVQTPPVVSVTPAGDTLYVHPGEFVHLECRSTGTPTPTVQWNKYRQDSSSRAYLAQQDHLTSVMSNVAVYEITSASYNDEGTYICLGRNDAGAHESRIMLIVDNRDNIPNRGDITGNRTHYRGEDPGTGDDRYNPRPHGSYKDNEHPHSGDEQTFNAPVGTRADLRCNIEKDSGQQIYTNWIRADNTSLPQDSQTRDGSLIINNVQPSDAGKYQCLILSSSGSILYIQTANLLVLSEEDMCALQAPPKIVLNPSRQVVTPGDNALIECITSGDQPITVSWTGTNRSLPATVYTRDGVLQFHGIQLSDAGIYRCTAVNAYGEADAVAEVLVQENVQQPSIISADNRDQTAQVGATLTLTCSVRSGYTGQVHWVRGTPHSQLPDNARDFGHQLQIYNIQVSDAGQYVCETTSGDRVHSDYINLHVVSPTTRAPVVQPALEIQASSDSPRVGDHLELYCRSTESGVIATWTKLSGRPADNVHIAGGTLRISSIRPENGGVYRCEARGYDGMYQKDHMVDVIDDVKEEDIAIKSAPQGYTVLLECKTDLDGPVTFRWSKQKGTLPRYVDIHARSIELKDVGSNDAGTYVCTSSNSYKTLETPTILLITGIVPYFTQAPSSYIGLQPLADSHLQFTFEISFKPEVHDGLILYNGDKKNKANGDFISLSLVNGMPEFRFNLGHNSSATIVSGDKPLTIGQWHTIKVVRNRKKATMYVDGEGPYTATASTKYLGLTLGEPLYLGGVPSFDEISPYVGAHGGMVGCISRFKIGHAYTDIIKEAQVKKGTTNCETCSDNPCRNRGVCQESLAKEGFMCICPSGYSGAACDKLRSESCSAHTCGTGRCIDTEESYECMCPLGKVGRNCEREIEIIEPAFSRNAYIAYPTPSQLRRLKISMKVKPKDLSDGVIAYSGQSEEGDGDFVSLAVKDRHIEFRFDVGNGPTVIRSANEVKPNQWVVITASRTLNEGRLIVNGDVPIVGRSVGNHKALNLDTLFYVGGVDSQRIKLNSGVGVNVGFYGCVSEVTVSSITIHMIQSVEDSANVQDCSTIDNDENNLDNDIGNSNTQYSHGNSRYDTRQTGCSSSPCRNDGQCYPLSPVEYKCSCVHGYSGVDCEIAPNLCDQLRPCQNRGSCHGNTTQYTCDCPLGFTGINCETTTAIRNDVHFSGNGYLEFNRNLLPHDRDNQDEVIAMELSTNSSHGLVFWHGQTPDQNGSGQDYIALSVVNGYLEFSYDLGTGPAIIYNDRIAVNDGKTHKIILKRQGREGSIEVDDDFTETGEASGLTNQMNCNGNIYLGGTPNISLMTGGRFHQGFNGCIHGFEVQDTKTLDLGETALSGLNVKACYRSDVLNSVFGDDYDEDMAN